MAQSKRKRRRGGQPGPRPPKVSEILVLDRNGDQVKVYEREFREIMPVTQRERKQIGYELSSGERLQMVDSVTFILIATGAKFVRIQK